MNFKQTVDLVERWSQVDTAGLADLLSQTQCEYGLGDADLAELFKTSIPTVQNWKTGVSTPHPNGLESVVKAITEALMTPYEGHVARLALARRRKCL